MVNAYTFLISLTLLHFFPYSVALPFRTWTRPLLRMLAFSCLSLFFPPLPPSTRGLIPQAISVSPLSPLFLIDSVFYLNLHCRCYAADPRGSDPSRRFPSLTTAYYEHTRKFYLIPFPLHVIALLRNLDLCSSLRTLLCLTSPLWLKVLDFQIPDNLLSDVFSPLASPCGLQYQGVGSPRCRVSTSSLPPNCGHYSFLPEHSSYFLKLSLIWSLNRFYSCVPFISQGIVGVLKASPGAIFSVSCVNDSSFSFGFFPFYH